MNNQMKGYRGRGLEGSGAQELCPHRPEVCQPPVDVFIHL